ncbi:MAG: hypothetical protein IJH04_02695, partial [Eggerthellaceae bacterium]|nr:hypothetical protein [Eggerthellaceae bacterium]
MKFVRVHLDSKVVEEEEFVQSDFGFFGGRGLVARLLTDYCDPRCDPLGPDNPLIYTTGYFAGTALSSSNRLSVGAKSPLTGTIKESNSGGTFSRRMTEHGLKVVMLLGQASDWTIVHVDADGGFSLLDASEYVGMWNYAFHEAMVEQYGDKVACASVGPVGEKLGRIGSIAVNEQGTNYPCRLCARGGMGAVMGSKKVKAFVMERPSHVFRVQLEPDAAKEFRELNKVVTDAIRSNPLTGQAMPLYGSAAGVDTTGKMGALPYKNFSGEFAPDWERLGTKMWRNRLLQHGGESTIPCQAGCVVRCSNSFNDEKGEHLSSGIEYETVALMGPNLGIFDPQSIATLDRLCDDMGMDSIDAGNALSVMMEQGVMDFGDAEAAIAMVKSVLDDGSGLGSVLRHGCAAVADELDVLGKDGPVRVAVSKGQAFAAYDPRILRGYGLTWERGPQGADHTAGSAATYLKDMTPIQQADYSLAMNCSCDCCMCLFPWAAVTYNPDAKAALARMAGILAGMDEGPGPEMWLENGTEILNLEYAFNEKAGFKHEDDLFYGG